MTELTKQDKEVLDNAAKSRGYKDWQEAKNHIEEVGIDVAESFVITSRQATEERIKDL